LYTKFESGDVIENAQADIITSAMWSNNDGELKLADTELYTSSVQMAASGLYYAEIFRDEPQATASAEPQFAVAYGHVSGSGSAPVSEYASEGMTPTKTVYQQYRNLLLAPGDEHFTITDTDGTVNNESGSFFINVNRQRYKERIDPGNWQLNISSSQFADGTGAGARFYLIDDSGLNSAKLGDSGALYKVITGSLEDGAQAGAKQFGWFYPDMGVMMLSPRVMNYASTANTNYCWCPGGGNDVGGSNQNNIVSDLIGAFTSSVAVGSGNSDPSSSFQARASEKVYATHYFIRLKNAEYNFSNNPSFTSGSQGAFAHPSMYRDPKVYITTVGMYNDRNELLAIAKLSKPLLKSFTREALIRVKLEF
jgi:hypothetical protein